MSEELQEENDSEMEREHKNEEDFEDEVVKKLMEGVKLIIKDQEITDDAEIIKADLVEIKKDFEPEVPAESIGSLDEELSKRMDQAVETLYNLIADSRERFKESLKNQLLTFRKHVEEMGKSIARAFAEKLKLKYTERVLRKMYEDIVQRELRARQEELIYEVLEAVKPFYSSLQNKLEETKKILLEIKGLYHDWVKAYTYVVREVMDESSLDYEKLMREINKYKSQYEEQQNKIQELNMELAMKEKELADLREEIEKLKLQVKEIPGEEIDKLKETIRSQEELIAKIKQTNQETLDILRTILTNILGETLEEEMDSTKIKEITEKALHKLRETEDKLRGLREEIAAKEEEIAKLRRLLDEYKDAEKILDEYYNLKMEYSKLKGEYEALNEAYEKIKKENELLKNRLEEVTNQITGRISEETLKSELAKELEEKMEEIKNLREKLVEFERIKAENERLKILLENREKELETLRNKLREIEEAEATLATLRKELEEYKEMFGLSIGPAEGAVEAKYSELFAQIKRDLELMRKEVFEKAKQISDVISENKALKAQLEVKDKELDTLKMENEKIMKELEEVKTSLKQAVMERDELEKKVVELSRKVQELKALPEEFKSVLENTVIGKIYLILRDLKKVEMEKLAGAIGMPKIQLQREILKLAKIGVVKAEGDTIYYTGV